VLKVLLAVQTPRGRDLRQHVAAELLKELLPRTSGPASEAWGGPQVTASGLSDVVAACCHVDNGAIEGLALHT